MIAGLGRHVRAMQRCIMLAMGVMVNIFLTHVLRKSAVTWNAKNATTEALLHRRKSDISTSGRQLAAILDSSSNIFASSLSSLFPYRRIPVIRSCSVFPCDKCVLVGFVTTSIKARCTD